MSTVNQSKGSVKFYNPEKGFGFIIDDATGDEIFVHRSGIKAGVSLGQDARVQFNIENGKRGLNATSVEKI